MNNRAEKIIVAIFFIIFAIILAAWLAPAFGDPGSLGPIGPGLTSGTRATTAQHGTGFRLRPGARACWKDPNGSGRINLDALPWGPTGDGSFNYEEYKRRYGKPLPAYWCVADAELFWVNGEHLAQQCRLGTWGTNWDCVPTQQEEYDCAAVGCAPRPVPPPPVEPPAPPPPPAPPVVPPVLPGVCDPPCQRMVVPGGSIEWRPSLLSTGRVGPTPLSWAGGGR